MIDTRIKTLFWVLFVIVRYIAAVIVSFIASIATFFCLGAFLSAWASNSNSPYVQIVCFSSAGLAGVAFGSFCLPRNHWPMGSLFLLLLGLGFALCVFSSFFECDLEPSDFSPLVSLAAGGIIPVVIHFLLRPGSEPRLTPVGAVTSPQQ